MCVRVCVRVPVELVNACGAMHSLVNACGAIHSWSRASRPADLWAPSIAVKKTCYNDIIFINSALERQD